MASVGHEWLRLEKTRSSGPGAVPVVAVQVDAGVTVPAAVAARESGDCRWTELVGPSCVSLLVHLTNSEVLRRAATPSSATTTSHTHTTHTHTHTHTLAHTHIHTHTLTHSLSHAHTHTRTHTHPHTHMHTHTHIYTHTHTHTHTHARTHTHTHTHIVEKQESDVKWFVKDTDVIVRRDESGPYCWTVF